MDLKFMNFLKKAMMTGLAILSFGSAMAQNAPAQPLNINEPQGIVQAEKNAGYQNLIMNSINIVSQQDVASVIFKSGMMKEVISYNLLDKTAQFQLPKIQELNNQEIILQKAFAQTPSKNIALQIIKLKNDRANCLQEVLQDALQNNTLRIAGSFAIDLAKNAVKNTVAYNVASSKNDFSTVKYIATYTALDLADHALLAQHKDDHLSSSLAREMRNVVDQCVQMRQAAQKQYEFVQKIPIQ